MKITSLSLLLVFACGILAAQEPVFKPLVCEGTIPKECLSASAKKYEREIEKLKKENVSGKEKKTIGQFALESNFWEDDLLQSGLVLFNDPASLYLKDVMDQITAQDPELQDKINLYTLRTPVVNAFASGRGNIYVTLGMLAQLEDESQLAYILSHELVHVKKKHTLNLYLLSKNAKISKSEREVLDNVVFKDAVLARNKYSKEIESEADEEGLQLFLNSSYSTATLHTVYDVLRYANTPFDNIPFDHSFLESEWYHIPSAYRLEKTSLITGTNEEADDTRSTHPNISKRRQVLENTLANIPDEGHSRFLVSADRFKQVQDLARLELPMLYLQKGFLADAIYNAFLLKQTHPDNLYLDKIVAKALYLNAKYKNDIFYKPEEISHEEVEGELQQVYYLLSQTPAKDATVLALRYAWSLAQKYPDDVELANITSDLFQEMPYYFEDLNAFLNTPPPTSAIDTLAQTAEENLSKYDRIRRQNQEAGDLDNYWKYAFLGYVDDPDFKDQFKQGLSRFEEREEDEAYYKSKAGKRKLKRMEKKGVALGIKKVVMVNPNYVKLDNRKETEYQFIPTEAGEENFRKLAKEVAKISGLKVTILDVNDLRENQTDQFNDIRMLNDWFSEQIRHFELSLTVGSNQEQVDVISEKYGTDYFLWTGVVSVRETDLGKFVYLVAGLAYPFILPYSLYKMVQPSSTVYSYAILYDVRTGKRRVLKFDGFKRGETDALIKAHLYDVMSQIVTTP